jgi:hypothetical protein
MPAWLRVQSARRSRLPAARDRRRSISTTVTFPQARGLPLPPRRRGRVTVSAAVQGRAVARWIRLSGEGARSPLRRAQDMPQMSLQMADVILEVRIPSDGHRVSRGEFANRSARANARPCDDRRGGGYDLSGIVCSNCWGSAGVYVVKGTNKGTKPDAGELLRSGPSPGRARAATLPLRKRRVHTISIRAPIPNLGTGRWLLRRARGCGRLGIMPILRTYRVFISHAWHRSEHYERVRQWLDEAANFRWENRSVPEHDPLRGDLEKDLRDQMRDVDVFLILAGMYASHSDWIEFELNWARIMARPILGIKPWGNINMPASVQSAAKEIVNWNSVSIIDAIRRNASPSGQ